MYNTKITKKHLKLANALISLKFLLNMQKLVTKRLYDNQCATIIDSVNINLIKFLNIQKNRKRVEIS